MLRFVVASLFLASLAAGLEDYKAEDVVETNPVEKYYQKAASNVNVDEIPSKQCQASDVDPASFRFYLYTRMQPYQYELRLDDNGESLRRSSYNVRKVTKFLIHGWAQSPDEAINILRDYLYAQNVDVIVMDWSKYSKMCSYNSSNVVVVREAAKALSNLMQMLTGYGAVSRRNFHVIGFSVGAHIAGIAGKYISPLRIARISGLDPVGYHFDYPGLSKLQNGDADFVDVIHTSQPFIGTQRLIGDLSFYPNGGIHPQKPCPEGEEGLVCSSLVSVSYWHESIIRPHEFQAVRCENWVQFTQGKCPLLTGSPNLWTSMGEYANPEALKGKYYLETNSQKPYSKTFKQSSGFEQSKELLQA